MAEYEVRMADIFPQGEIRVEDEKHLYQVFEGDFGNSPKDEYTLDKAPVNELEGVNGLLDGDEHEFVKGVDYELSGDKERLVWLSGDRPDAGTEFSATYRTQSIMSRYMEASNEEFTLEEQQLKNRISSKFVDQATGEDLDHIGRLFGNTIGARRGRTDQEYREYLDTIVQSFISRGTKSGIRAAIAAVFETDPSNIEIIEDFSANSYDVRVPPAAEFSGSLLETVAELADPAGVDFKGVRYRIDADGVGIQDGFDITLGGIDVPDEMAVDDGALVNADYFTQTESISLDDAAVVDGNTVTSPEDTQIDDTATAIQSDVSSAEGAGATDAHTVEALQNPQWEPDSATETTEWDYFEWQ